MIKKYTPIEKYTIISDSWLIHDLKNTIIRDKYTILWNSNFLNDGNRGYDHKCENFKIIQALTIFWIQIYNL